MPPPEPWGERGGTPLSGRRASAPDVPSSASGSRPGTTSRPGTRESKRMSEPANPRGWVRPDYHRQSTVGEGFKEVFFVAGELLVQDDEEERIAEIERARQETIMAEKARRLRFCASGGGSFLVARPVSSSREVW